MKQIEREALFIVVRVLYGLKPACAAFRASMTKKLDDIWLRPDVKFNGDEYYEYVLMYADEIVAISMDVTAVLKAMKEILRNVKIGKI